MHSIYEYLLSKSNHHLANVDKQSIDNLDIDSSVTVKYKKVISKLLNNAETDILSHCKYWQTSYGLHIVYKNECIYQGMKMVGAQFIVDIDKLKASFIQGTNGVFVSPHFSLKLKTSSKDEFLDDLLKEINSIKTCGIK